MNRCCASSLQHVTPGGEEMMLQFIQKKSDQPDGLLLSLFRNPIRPAVQTDTHTQF